MFQGVALLKVQELNPGPQSLRGHRQRPPRSCPTLLAGVWLFIGLKTALIRDPSKEAGKLLLYKVL